MVAWREGACGTVVVPGQDSRARRQAFSCHDFASHRGSRRVRCPSHPSNARPSFQSAAKMIKETMDKKFGSSWHVVIGEGFGFEITHEVKNLLYLYFGGTLAVCVWKCS